MVFIRLVLALAAALQVAIVVGAFVVRPSLRSRLMRVGMRLAVFATLAVTLAVLANLWADRVYDVSDYALAAIVLAVSAGEAAGVVVHVRYIGAQQEELMAAREQIMAHQKDLEHSRDFYLRLFDDSPLLIWRSDTSARCDYFNRAWLDFRGRTVEQEQGDGWVGGIHPEDLDQRLAAWREAFQTRQPFDTEYRLLNAQSEYRWIADHARPFFSDDGEFLGYIGSCSDVTVSKEQAGKLAYLSDHDALTGLVDRRALRVALDRAFARAQRNVPSILLFIDVDHFKAINDRMGHPAGDAVLVSVAHLLTAGVRTADVVARLGGDEFAVLLEMIGTEEAVAIAQRLVADARENLSDIGLSIGVASMADAADITEVLRRADERMGEAKNGGGSRVVVDIRATHST